MTHAFTKSLIAASCLYCLCQTPANAQAGSLRSKVAQHAAANGVPANAAHAIVMLESRYRAHIIHKGNYGLMQIRYATARAGGYLGSPEGLLSPDINLQFGMKYFARGWRASGGDLCRAIAHYQTGRLVRTVPAASLTYCARARRIMTES